MIRRSVALAAALCVLAPSAAEAATADVEAGALRLQSSGSQREDFSLVAVSDGSYFVRRRAGSPSRLVPGPGCRLNRPRELRCAGAIDRIDVALGDGDSSFRTQGLAVPITVDSGNGNDGILIGSANSTVFGSSAGAVVDAGAGTDFVLIVGVPGASYVVDGGPGRDTLASRGPNGTGTPAFTLRGGDGRDSIIGAEGPDELEGGPGDDSIDGNGGSDTILGGSGTDTAIFTAPQLGEPRLSVSLDGQANDGQPGENAMVGPDVENVTFDNPFEGGPTPGGNTLVGDNGPNVLIGAGTVRGLGGNDVIVGTSADPNTLDGGDGDDRIGARARDEYTEYRVADTIACGNGNDVAITDVRDPHPADCEHFNLGLRVSAPTARVGPDGYAAVRVSCDDIAPCDLGTVVLLYKRHVVSEDPLRKRVTIAPGRSALRRVRLNRWLRRPGRFSTLAVTATPLPARALQDGGLITGFPRVIKLIRAR